LTQCRVGARCGGRVRDDAVCAMCVRWMTVKMLGYDLLECEHIIIPIHLPNHWVLGWINMAEHRLEYLDSLGGGDNGVLANLTRWLGDEFNSKSKPQSTNLWVRHTRKGIPTQSNGCDCGMFVLAYIEGLVQHYRDPPSLTASEGRILNTLTFDFSQTDMPDMRNKARKRIETYCARKGGARAEAS
jgi:Ulp1 family protease